ncbi:MAG TPA: zinc-binding dehydrogenase [Planctomycetota bacterium]|nr:zinc-binding dehydrogenase [Planctomycetota bacterium]
MKACFIREFGGLDKVMLGDLANPLPTRGEAIVRIRAAALNHLDLWVLKGRPGVHVENGHVLGSDAAGTVVALGDGVAGVAVGEEVVIHPGLSCGHCPRCRAGDTALCAQFSIIGVSRPGTFAELISVPVENLAPRPTHLSWEEAAALPLAHLTAWRMLFTRARLAPGETVLVHGVGGGVATAALQLARMAGAEVIVTSSSAQKLAHAKALGAAWGIDYKREDVGKRVRDVTSGRGVDVVIDTVGAATLAGSFAAVRKGGRIVTCGVTGGSKAELELRDLYWNQVEFLGSTLGSRGELLELIRAVSANQLKPVVYSTRPLDQARDALATMEKGEQMGKLVLRVS